MHPTRLFDLLTNLKEKYIEGDIFVYKEDGQWINHSIDEFVTNAENLSYGLIQEGIVAGDKIATISNNRPEWSYLDMAMLQVGAVHVPIYPTISEEDFKFIFNDAEVKMVFVSDADLYSKVQNI